MFLVYLSPFFLWAGCMWFAHTRNWGFSTTLAFTALITFPYIIALAIITA